MAYPPPPQLLASTEHGGCPLGKPGLFLPKKLHYTRRGYLFDSVYIFRIAMLAYIVYYAPFCFVSSSTVYSHRMFSSRFLFQSRIYSMKR